MNIVLILVLIILAGSVLMGYWRGFVRIVFSLVSMVLLLVLVSFATPHITGYLKEHTGVYQDLEQICTEKVQQAMEQMLLQDTDTQLTEDVLVGLSLPQVWLKQLMEKTADTLNQTAVAGGVHQRVGTYIADWILNGIVFWAAFILFSIVLRFLVGLLDIVTKLPIINGANRLLGAAAGLIQGLLIVWLLLFLVAVACTSQIGQTILSNIEDNVFLSYLYQHNLILYFFQFMFM